MRLAASLPIGALVAACGGDSNTPPASPTFDPRYADHDLIPREGTPAPTATPEPPFIIPAGEQKLALMPGTPYETPLWIYGSGLPGKIVMSLGGVHGNEPGGWMAAEQLQAKFRPARGAFLVVPRANKIPIRYFERTLPELGDLNRLYPGDPNGQPMAQMAAQVVDTLRTYRVDCVIDMHESWAFYKDRPQNGTAYLGQTVSTAPSEPAITFVRDIVAAVNSRIQAPREELFDRPFPGPSEGPDARPGGPAPPGSPQGSSSLALPRWLPNITAILVEMGQQQPLDRRVALHVDIFNEMARRLNVIDA
uniref:Succinylglutamate desuccinylase/Aspartoacylase catalytic domain-containing protein n=1 Tax=uncultured bacterium 5G4 TaxID=1701326 RepID=A0A166H3M6_9BACT|nr:hypothetical protein 5G4_034 [uncultured bacterium 5G4]